MPACTLFMHAHPAGRASGEVTEAPQLGRAPTQKKDACRWALEANALAATQQEKGPHKRHKWYDSPGAYGHKTQGQMELSLCQFADHLTPVLELPPSDVLVVHDVKYAEKRRSRGRSLARLPRGCKVASQGHCGGAT